MDFEPSYQALASVLASRVKIIADREWFARDPAGHLAALGAVSGEIEELASALPRPISGELAHYLERRSYEKALAWIRQHLALSTAGE